MDPVVTLLGQLTQEIAKADAQVDEAYESYLKNTYSTQEAKLERGWQSCVKRRKMLYKERKAAAMHLSRPGPSAMPAVDNPCAVQSGDTTRAYLDELMANRDKQPPWYDELTDELRLLPKPLPLTPSGFDSLPHSSLDAEDEHQSLVVPTRDCPAIALGECIGVALRKSAHTHGGKHAVTIATDQLQAIGFMREVLGFMRIAVTADNIVDWSGATTGLDAPDALLVLQNLLMCKGKAKVSTDKLDKAQEELREKMEKWSPQYHGTREYMICYAAAGHLLRYHAVTRGGGNIKALSPEFDLRSASDRLKAMHTAISMLTIILQQLTHQFPTDPLPFGVTLEYKHSSIFYSGEHVEKMVDLGKFVYGDKDALQAVYTVLMDLPLGTNMSHPRGLIRSLEEPELKDGRYWKVKLPMGLRKKPSNLDSLRQFLRDILHGLDALHQKGIVHRDIRHPNILKMADKEYVLIDFEISGRAGKVPPFEPLSHWPPECKANTPYQPAADIYCVGALMSDVELPFKLNSAAASFRDHLMADDPTQRPSASEALNLPWLSSAQ